MARQAGTARLAGLRRVARLYVKSRLGMIGLVIIVFFLALAVFSPELASNPPLNYQVGSARDIPAWARIFPQYSNVSVEVDPVWAKGFADQAALASWAFEGPSINTTVVPGIGPLSTPNPGSILVKASIPENSNATNPYLKGALVLFSMSQPFQFTGFPPTHFVLSASLYDLNMTGFRVLYVNFIITNPNGNFSMGATLSTTLATAITVTTSDAGHWKNVNVLSGLLYNSGIPVYQTAANPSNIVFNVTGSYRFTMQVLGVPTHGTTQPSTSFYVGSVKLHLSGGAYGLLGTDKEGNDVWSQEVWGSRISLEIGILSGIGAVALGTLAGLAAGYLGGLWDEFLSRFTDFMLVLPFLPLLFIATTIISQNADLVKNIYLWVVVIFVVLSWPFVAKIIRSQVLSVKERPYVEASRAVGGGTGHIIRRHILPNVMGLVYSQVALNVGGFILLDAALDFLTQVTHSLTAISWGIMLTQALPDAVGNPGASYVWWWFLPPGISIGALSLAFVLVGFALDQIFNPRLRAR
ncbi:MAG: ABC transporter permease [Nitrososphaerales archaeon]|jgi:peptide/nickel transport system permease protein